MKNKKNITMFWIIMLVIVFVISNVLINHEFMFFGHFILTSALIYPIIYFCANRICEKGSVKQAIIATILAVIIQTLIFVGSHYLTNEIIIYEYAIKILTAFFISVIINIILYNKFIKGTSAILRLVLVYIGVILINHFIIYSTLDLMVLVKIFIALVLVLIEALLNKNIS